MPYSSGLRLLGFQLWGFYCRAFGGDLELKGSRDSDFEVLYRDYFKAEVPRPSKIL